MATETKRLYVGRSDELLVDARNARIPFQKNVFIFSKRYVVADGDYAAGDTIVVEFDGAQSIQFCAAKEILAATNTDLNLVEAALSGTGRQGYKVTSAATDANSLAVEIFAIVSV